MEFLALKFRARCYSSFGFSEHPIHELELLPVLVAIELWAKKISVEDMPCFIWITMQLIAPWCVLMVLRLRQPGWSMSL